VDSPVDLLAVFKERELVVKRREVALAKLQKLKVDPEVTRCRWRFRCWRPRRPACEQGDRSRAGDEAD